jgi:hypothetical protein
MAETFTQFTSTMIGTISLCAETFNITAVFTGIAVDAVTGAVLANTVARTTVGATFVRD